MLWVTKHATAVLLASLILSCPSCEDPYKTNPDLSLLLKKEGHFLFNPLLSADGTRLYFLDDARFVEGGYGGQDFLGDMWVRNLSDSTEKRLLVGNICAAALSVDGRRLVAVDALTYPRDSTLFLVLDTAAAAVESVYVNHPGEQIFRPDVAFWRRDDSLVFNTVGLYTSSTQFYVCGLDGVPARRLVLELPWIRLQFDVFADDSIYADSVVRGQPAVNPVNHRWAVFPVNHDFTNAWKLHDRAADTAAFLGADTDPYVSGRIGWPSWTRDGNDLIFAARYEEGGKSLRMEIWKLASAIPESLLQEAN